MLVLSPHHRYLVVLRSPLGTVSPTGFSVSAAQAVHGVFQVQIEDGLQRRCRCADDGDEDLDCAKEYGVVERPCDSALADRPLSYEEHQLMTYNYDQQDTNEA